MRRVPWFLVFLLFVISPPVLSAVPHEITLRILDDEKPQAGVEVVVKYPDPERTVGKTLTLNTDSAGFVRFSLEEKVFWVTVPSLNPEVIGREFKVPDSKSRAARWDVHPRRWKREEQP